MTRDSTETDGQSPCRDSPDQIQLVGNADSYMPPTPTGIQTPQSMPEFPDFEGYVWPPQVENRGPALVQPYEHLPQAGRHGEGYDRPDIPACTGMIVDGADSYLREYALQEIDYPDYYTRIDSWESPWRWSVDSMADINRQLLEYCLRLVNTSGGIETDQTHVVLCAPGTLVTAGPTGIYLTDLRETPNSQFLASDVQSLSDRPTPPGEVHTSIAGFDVPEEDPAYQNALARHLSIVYSALSDTDIAQYSHLDTTEHVFERASGGQVRVTDGDLARLDNRQMSVTDVCGRYQAEVDCDHDTVQITDSDTAGAIGEPISLPDRVSIDDVTEPWADPTETRQLSETETAVMGYDISWITHTRMGIGTRNDPIGATLKLDIAFVVSSDLSIRTLQYDVETVGEHPSQP